MVPPGLPKSKSRVAIGAARRESAGRHRHRHVGSLPHANRSRFLKEHPLTFALGFALIVALSPMATDLYLPAIPAITVALSADIQIIELSISTYMLGAAAGQVVAAPISDRVGRKPVIQAGIGLFFLATIGCMLAETAAHLLLFRVLQGVGAGAAAVNVAAAVGDIYEEHEAARVFATIHIIVLTAPLVAPLVGALLITWFPWQVNFGFMAGYAVIAAVFAVTVLPETIQRDSDPPSQRSIVRSVAADYWAVLTRRRAFLFNLVVALSFSCFVVFLTDAAFVYLDYFAAPTLLFPVLFGGSIVTMMITNRINLWLLIRFRPRHVIPVGHAVQVLSSAILLAYSLLPEQSLSVFVPIVMFATSANALIGGNTMARYISLFKERRGTASAMTGVLQFAIAGLIVIGISLVHDGTPRTMALGMLGCAVASATCTALIFRSERNDP